MICRFLSYKPTDLATVCATTSALRPRWDILEWFDIFQLHCCPESEAKSHSERSIWHCARCAADILYMNAMHAIRLGFRFMVPYILLQNNIFTFFFYFSFVGPKEMVGFTFHGLFKYSFNLVDVLASGVRAHSRTGPLVRRWRCLRSHSTSSRRTSTQHQPSTERKKMTENICFHKLTKSLAFWCHWMACARMPARNRITFCSIISNTIFAFASNWCTPIWARSYRLLYGSIVHMVSQPEHAFAIHIFFFHICDEMRMKSVATKLDAKVFVMSVASVAHMTRMFFY